MAWPFTPDPPTFDSTPSNVPNLAAADVPNCPTGSMWIMGLDFNNPTSAPIAITVLDANGKAVLPGMNVYPNQPFESEKAFKPVTGPLTWQASASGLIGHIWGY